jgi:aromatic ring-opening dioxygenase catalytic subunit (LigB family)
MGTRVLSLLKNAGIDAKANKTFNFIHDTFLLLIRMFPESKSNIPVVIVSANARMDPHFHTRIGSALRPLRYEDALIIGSGGAVHNLYRNNWMQMVLWRDSLAMPIAPMDCMLEFRQAFEDAVTTNSGPALRRAITRLMKHPRFRDAHGTDEHFIPACFVAGAAGAPEDEGTANRLTAECWELVNMANSQFQLGDWE